MFHEGWMLDHCVVCFLVELVAKIGIYKKSCMILWKIWGDTPSFFFSCICIDTLAQHFWMLVVILHKTELSCEASLSCINGHSCLKRGQEDSSMGIQMVLISEPCHIMVWLNYEYAQSAKNVNFPLFLEILHLLSITISKQQARIAHNYMMFQHVSKGFNMYQKVSTCNKRLQHVSEGFTGFQHISKGFNMYQKVSTHITRFQHISQGFNMYQYVSKCFKTYLRFQKIPKGFKKTINLIKTNC